eukprot:TRINITY_DN5714_c0_g1_i3.p1 TRINITY_DN5714_c0_g1~~TRINITY_DN5714_c0_g1_i3.p1  ORF type:complete len:423 (+),score=50.66 TRINITY_DN5714_c0_g1_i3:185-1453(+)
MSVESRRHFLFQVASGAGGLAVSGSALANPSPSCTTPQDFGVNVCDYGADPTGQLESKGAFSLAIAAAHAMVGASPQTQQAGAVIFVPRGQYRFDSQLTIDGKNGIAFLGEGTRCEGVNTGLFGSVIFKGNNFPSSEEALIAVVNADGFGFKGIALWGNQKAGSGLILQNVNAPILEDIVLRNHLGWGLKVADCSLGTLTGIKSRDNTAGGLQIVAGYSQLSGFSSVSTSQGMRVYDSHCLENIGPQLMIGADSASASGPSVSGLTIMASQFENPAGTEPTVRITQLKDSFFGGNNFVQIVGKNAPAVQLGAGSAVQGVTISNLSFVSNYFQYSGSAHGIVYSANDYVGSSFVGGRRASFIDCRFQGSKPYYFNFGSAATTTPSNPGTGQITFLFSPKPTNTTTNIVYKEAMAFTPLTVYTP